MAKTIATTHGIDLAAFDQANARLAALRRVKDQATLIEQLQAKFRREEMREIEHLNKLREEAEKAGAYEILTPNKTATEARVVS